MIFKKKKDKYYYALYSESRAKVKKISVLLFGGELPIKKIGAYYLAEYFLNSEKHTPLDIPRHLFFGTTILMVISLSWQGNPGTILYSNGDLFVTAHHYDKAFITKGKHTTYIDYVLFVLRYSFAKESINSLRGIEGSRLYYDIIEKCNYSNIEKDGYYHVHEYLEQKHQFFASSQNLSFDVFRGIYLIDLGY